MCVCTGGLLCRRIGLVRVYEWVNAHKTDKKKKNEGKNSVKYREKISSMETDERKMRTRLHNKRKRNEDFH